MTRKFQQNMYLFGFFTGLADPRKAIIHSYIGSILYGDRRPWSPVILEMKALFMT